MKPDRLHALVPAKLAFGAFLFLLPWIRISCTSSLGSSYEVLSQSGLEAAIGSVSKPDETKEERERRRELSKEVPPAPLIAAYGLILVTGAAVGFAMPASRLRRVILASLVCVGLACLAAQCLVGFPIVEVLLRDTTPAPDPPPPRKPNQVEYAIELEYTTAFHLSWIVCSLALLVVVAEPALSRTAEVRDEGRDPDSS